MPARKLTFASVRILARKLPGVVESTSWGTPALKLAGTLIACVPSHRSSEPDSLVVRVRPEDRDDMLATDPDVYYLPNHYVNYPFILVRLTHVRKDVLSSLLSDACAMAAKGKARAKPQRARKTAR